MKIDQSRTFLVDLVWAWLSITDLLLCLLRQLFAAGAFCHSVPPHNVPCAAVGYIGRIHWSALMLIDRLENQ